MTEADAQRFAVEWIEAWNSRDLDRILNHYADEVEVTSPFVETVFGPGKKTIKGKLAYQACNEHACLPPTSVPLSITVKVVPRGVTLKRVHTDVFDKIQFD